ncbi:hypothetical protein [Pseudomonas sp. S12(2018)]|uniref:hypothetical protein n=1 Tax=Pseudomonas sp. S12(2018) TaxID=2219664 RepID=UPI0020CCF59E|nr:hypothetical protein [Pseudomonas sp. S12(2018)]
MAFTAFIPAPNSTTFAQWTIDWVIRFEISQIREAAFELALVSVHQAVITFMITTTVAQLADDQFKLCKVNLYTRINGAICIADRAVATIVGFATTYGACRAVSTGSRWRGLSSTNCVELLPRRITDARFDLKKLTIIFDCFERSVFMSRTDGGDLASPLSTQLGMHWYGAKAIDLCRASC